jgi:2-polyprenyl-3-methyl-5-hydroxy-6-metoxy-1,4-benzoquinol methylase
MKIGAIAQNPLEWIALKAKMVPMPLLYSHFGFMQSKFLLEAVDTGIFEFIGNDKKSATEIALGCKLNEKALTGTMSVLATMGLLNFGEGKFELTAQAKKYLLKDSPDSVYYMMLFDNRVCMQWMDYFPEFLRTGKGLQYHDTFNDEEWFLYQNAMEAAASGVAKETARKMKIPANATKMLDIGGSHGLYSAAFCQKAPQLQSTILDLPKAVEKAKPILEKHHKEGRISYKAGNILTEDLGEAQYDYILMASVAHHLTGAENEAVAKKVKRALRPGGIYTIMEFIRQDKIQKDGDMIGAMGNLFFLLSSTTGLWSQPEIASWMTNAGLSGIESKSFLSLPGYKAISGYKR